MTFGTEELAHLEIVGTICSQLIKGADPKYIADQGLGSYYVDHDNGVFPQSGGNGVPFSAGAFAVKGDPIADLTEDMAAEEKARATYEHLIDLCADDPDVIDPLRFLRQREVVHFQRFGECLRSVQDKLNSKHCFYRTDYK